MAGKRSEVTVAQFLSFQIDVSQKTQREIAREIGYQNANVITMFKQGLTKVPIPVAPKLAIAIGADPGVFLRMALDEYIPDLRPEIERHIGGLCTRNELAIIKLIRSVTKDKDPELPKPAEKHLLNWVREHLL